MLTPDEMTEYILCRDNFEYFCNNYLTLDNGSKFIFNKTQKGLVKVWDENNKTDSTTERQEGSTTLMAAYALHHSIFNPYKCTAFVGWKLAPIEHELNIVKNFYEQLPIFIKPKLVKNNKKSLEFENNSEIFVCSANNCNVMRGRAFSLTLVSQLGFFKKDCDFITGMYPIVASGYGKYIAVTSYDTPQKGWN